MGRVLMCVAMALLLAACGTMRVTDADIDAAAATADYGDYRSETLTVKAWEALAAKDYAALFVYTRACVARYAEEGRTMNASLDGFARTDQVNDYWALNDVGTSLFIMAQGYADQGRYREAADTLETLASDFGYAQCWDPKGWYWRPADGAESRARRYRHQARGQR